MSLKKGNSVNDSCIGLIELVRSVKAYTMGYGIPLLKMPISKATPSELLDSIAIHLHWQTFQTSRHKLYLRESILGVI
jgi:hypothetical protein